MRFRGLLVSRCHAAALPRLNSARVSLHPEQTENAIAFGATGIGLTRTEHMFFEGNRIDSMREMILADNVEDRKKALAKLLPFQKADFVGIFKALKGFPATIRFLDPPLHEFLPHEDAAQNDLAKKMGVPVAKIKQRVKELHEFNSMLGFRGCRLGIVYSEISKMKARAVFEAAAEVQKAGIKVKPEVMIPLAGFKRKRRFLVVTPPPQDAIIKMALEYRSGFSFHRVCRLDSMANNGWPFSNGSPGHCPRKARPSGFA